MLGGTAKGKGSLSPPCTGNALGWWGRVCRHLQPKGTTEKMILEDIMPVFKKPFVIPEFSPTFPKQGNCCHFIAVLF